MDAPIRMNVSVASKILAAPSIARNTWAVEHEFDPDDEDDSGDEEKQIEVDLECDKDFL